MAKLLYIVHCVDAEGPLYDPQLQTYGDWGTIESMLARVTTTSFRERVPDSFGNGWIYNWFCLDHVGYEANPRRRDLGDHKVFDYYRKWLNGDDGIYFHYHPLPYNRDAHSCATFYFNQNHIYRILARKIIDRQWFPAVFRPGFHTIRPDSNWFLEQWIPFDYSNQASDGIIPPDMANGRWGDWRRAPKIWGAYHPDHDDYQILGTSRRWIFRCLNMWARLRQLEQLDVDAAFKQAQENKTALLAFTDHDFRNIGADVTRVLEMITSASKKYPDVKFKYSNAVDGARQYLGLEQIGEIGFKIHLTNLKKNSLLMQITSETNLFGPQPFLAIKTKDGNYFYDNFDFNIIPRSWFYTFDWQTFPPSTIEKIGVASANSNGLAEVLVHDFNKNKTKFSLQS